MAHFHVTMTPLPIRIAIWAWLIAALLAGNAGLLQRLPIPAIQGLLVGLTVICLLFYFKIERVRTWVNQLDLRILVLLHTTRLVGFYFLVLHRRGELPYDFAVPGGWGDIVVAVLALLIALLPMQASTRYRAITIWNVIGLMEITMVVITAARLGLQDPHQMHALTYLPLSLLPTFLVPVIIATHVIIFCRLRRERIST